MDEPSKVYLRVQQAAESLSLLLNGRLNVPLGDYINIPDLNALLDTLGMDVPSWNQDDLATILILRDSLYDQRSQARDLNETSEHSLEQFLSALDRLYADLDRVLREADAGVSEARETLIAQRSGQSVSKLNVPNYVDTLKSEAAEVLTHTHRTLHTTTFSLFSMQNSSINVDVNIDIFKKAKLTIQRLNASVFAVKLSLEQNVIFQGVMSFLHERADAIIKQINEVIEGASGVYGKVEEFVSDIKNLAEKGGRFTKMLGNFIESVFADDMGKNERILSFSEQHAEIGEAVYCGTVTVDGLYALAGQHGTVQIADADQARAAQPSRLLRADIVDIVELERAHYALATRDGLRLIRRGALRQVRPSMSEQVTAVAIAPWADATVLTASREGTIRQFRVPEDDPHVWESVAELRRKFSKVSKMIPIGERVAIAAGNQVAVIASRLQIEKVVPVGFEVVDVAEHSPTSLIACGAGGIVHINLHQGAYARALQSSASSSYTSAVALDVRTVVVGTEQGRLSAIDLDSNVELGKIELGFPIRGIIKAAHKLVVFGGKHGSKGRAITFVRWEETAIS